MAEPDSQPSTAIDPGEAVPQFQAEEIAPSKRKWQVSLHPGHLALLPAGEAQPYVFVRDDFFTKVELFPGMRFLALRTPLKVNLKLTRPGADALHGWFGPPKRAQLKLLLKRRYAFSVPVAVLFVLVALPFPGAASPGDKSLPFQPLNLAFGLTLLGLWAWSKIQPHPILFLLDSIWFAALAIGHFLLLCRSHHWWWSIWTILLLWMAVAGFRRWQQCRAK